MGECVAIVPIIMSSNSCEFALLENAGEVEEQMEIKVPLADEDVLQLTAFEELFAGFAHEIAQPLNAIMIASQVIQLKMEAASLTSDEKAFFGND